MICPFAVQKPINTNHGGTRSQHLGFVVHVQEGDGSLYGFFNNPASQVSAHFWCSQTGVLEQYLDTSVIAWAEAAGNDSYASCEFEGFATEAMTNEQILQGAALVSWLAASEGWPVTGPVPHGSAGVTTHCNPDGTPDPAWGNHVCPGPIRLGQVPALVAAAKPPPAPSTQEHDNMIAKDTKTGGYWVARSSGDVYTFAGAPYLGPLPKYKTQWGIGTPSNPVVGIVSDGAGGFTLATDNGGPQPNIYHITSDGQYAR